MNGIATNYINIQNLSRQYIQGETVVNALSGIELGFQRGEFGALVGPSGSGKSTLLNCMGALDKPTTGSVEIDGKDVTRLTGNELSDFRLQNIGFVFQAYNLVPVLTAYENVEYILLLQGVGPAERKQRIHALSKKMDMDDLMHRFPDQLVQPFEHLAVAVAPVVIILPGIIREYQLHRPEPARSRARCSIGQRIPANGSHWPVRSEDRAFPESHPILPCRRPQPLPCRGG